MPKKREITERNVIQVNPIIQSQKHMNLSELRLFALGLQDIMPHIKDDTPHNTEFPSTIVTNRQLEDLFALAADDKNKEHDYHSNIKILAKHVKKAFKSVIELNREDGGFSLFHMYSRMDYDPKVGLHIKFDPEMRPFLLDLKEKQYTSCPLLSLFKLQSTYAWRIFELMMQFKGYFKQTNEIYRDLTIEELRFALNVPDGKYAGRMDNFMSRVLDKPIKEINEKTEYLVRYEITGRSGKGGANKNFRLFMKRKNVEEKSESKMIPPNHPLLPSAKNDFASSPLQSTPSAPSPTNLPPSPIAPAQPVNSSATQPKPTIKTEFPNHYAPLISEMMREGLAESSVVGWLEKYGKLLTEKNFRLAQKHASNAGLTKEARTRYLAKCLNNNIVGKNEMNLQIRREIEEREQRLAAEKERYRQESVEIQKILEERLGKDFANIAAMPDFFGEKTPPQTAAPEPPPVRLPDPKPKRSTEEKIKSGEWWRKYTARHQVVPAMRAFESGMTEEQFLRCMEVKG